MRDQVEILMRHFDLPADIWAYIDLLIAREWAARTAEFERVYNATPFYHRYYEFSGWAPRRLFICTDVRSLP